MGRNEWQERLYRQILATVEDKVPHRSAGLAERRTLGLGPLPDEVPLGEVVVPAMTEREHRLSDSDRVLSAEVRGRISWRRNWGIRGYGMFYGNGSITELVTSLPSERSYFIPDP